MRVIVIEPDEDRRVHLHRFFEGEGHVVDSFDAWPDPSALIAEHEPHVVFVAPGLLDQALSAKLAGAFPDCGIRLTPQSDDAVADALREAEQWRRRLELHSRPFAAGQRTIIHDLAYSVLASPKKFHLPEDIPGWEKRAADQEGRFILQLQTGASDDRHRKAKEYLRVLRHFDRELWRESSYRLAHGSYKIAWMREQIGRWATILAFYVPDAEVDACPPPQNCSSRFAFLHHRMPMRYIYPIACVLNYGIRKALSPAITQAIAWSYEGDSETELASTGYNLFGLNAFLAQVAQAQVWSMEEFLNPDSLFLRGGGSRALRRTLGVYFEWWGWEFLWQMGDGLRDIVRRCHAGETWVERRAEAPFSPSFRQFREAASADL